MMNSDKPIEVPSDDRFGFAPYAEVIAKPLLAVKGPASFVIGIEGPWGFGKTSLLNLIQNSIESSRQ